MKYSLRATVLSSLLVPMTALANVALDNPGFESSFDGWTDTDPSALSGVANSGSKSAKISGSGGKVEQTVSLTANTNYTLSAFVRGSGTLGVQGSGINASTNHSSSDWQQVNVTFNSGSATSATIYGAYNGSEGRFDDFTLTAESGSTPPDNGGTDPVSCQGSSALTINMATDNGTNDGNVPANAIDGNLAATSRWSSNGIGKQITFDLGATAEVTDVRLAWYKGNQRNAYFEIDTSLDGQNWTSVLVAGQSSGTTQGFEDVDVLDSDARYVRVTGQGNSSSSWNSLIEAQIIGCTDGSGGGTDPVDPVDPPPTNPGNLDPNLPPSGNFDLLDWTLSVPIDTDGDGKADTIKEGPLSSGYENSSFFYTATDGGMVFKAPVAGAKTSTNTSYTRSELREMLRRGDTQYATKGVGGNNWVFGDAPSSDRNISGGVDGTLDATLSVNHVTTSGSSSQVGRVIIGQIHANDDEPVRLYYRKLPNNSKGSIYIAHEPNGGSDQWYDMIGSRSSSASNPSDGISLDEVFSYRIDVTGSTLTVTIIRDGKADVVQTVNMSNSGYTSGGQYMYFKAGVYNQNNTGNDNDYVQATFYKVENKHSGYAF